MSGQSHVVYFSKVSVKKWVDRKVKLHKVDVEVVNGCVIQLVITSLPGLVAGPFELLALYRW